MRPTIELELQLHRLDCLASNGNLNTYTLMSEELKALRTAPQVRQPLLQGRHLLELGLQAGPRIGQLLAQIRDLQLNDELKTPDDALAWVRREMVARP